MGERDGAPAVRETGSWSRYQLAGFIRVSPRLVFGALRQSFPCGGAVALNRADPRARQLLQPLLALSRPSSRAASPARTPPGTPQRFPSLPLAPLHSSSILPAQFPPRSLDDPTPTVETQGFVIYLTSGVGWLCYLVWSLLQDDTLRAIGVGWYPSRYDLHSLDFPN